MSQCGRTQDESCSKTAGMSRARFRGSVFEAVPVAGRSKCRTPCARVLDTQIPRGRSQDACLDDLAVNIRQRTVGGIGDYKTGNASRDVDVSVI